MATDIALLSEMLNDSAKLEEEKFAQRQVAHLGPGDIGPPKPSVGSAKVEKKKDPKAIWDDDEVDEARLLNLVPKSDNRPKYVKLGSRFYVGAVEWISPHQFSVEGMLQAEIRCSLSAKNQVR